MNKTSTYYIAHRKQRLTYATVYYRTHKERLNMLGRKRWYNNRIALLSILGNSCCNSDCPIPKRLMNPLCLHIDHKNGDGYLDKKRFKGNYLMLHYYLRHSGEALEKLQILCAYCHCLKTLTNRENQSELRRRE